MAGDLYSYSYSYSYSSGHVRQEIVCFLTICHAQKNLMMMHEEEDEEEKVEVEVEENAYARLKVGLKSLVRSYGKYYLQRPRLYKVECYQYYSKPH